MPLMVEEDGSSKANVVKLEDEDAEPEQKAKWHPLRIASLEDIHAQQAELLAAKSKLDEKAAAAAAKAAAKGADMSCSSRC